MLYFIYVFGMRWKRISNNPAARAANVLLKHFQRQTLPIELHNYLLVLSN